MGAGGGGTGGSALRVQPGHLSASSWATADTDSGMRSEAESVLTRGRASDRSLRLSMEMQQQQGGYGSPGARDRKTLARRSVARERQRFPAIFSVGNDVFGTHQPRTTRVRPRCLHFY